MEELKVCPFCGCEAKVIVEEDTFQIIGCSLLSMLCPSPKMVVYKRDGVWDYTYWNKRYKE